MEDVFDITKEILGLAPDDILPEKNEELTPEQSQRFKEVMTRELEN